MATRAALLLFALSLSLSAAAQTAAGKLDVTFIVTADTHIMSESPVVAKNHVRSLAVMKTATEPRLTWPKGLIGEGTPIPQPAAVFVAGDLSYEGRLRKDKPEWEMFRKLYLDRNTSELKMPVFPGAGNHDSWMHINQYVLGTHDLINWGVTDLVENSWKGSSVIPFKPGLGLGWWHPPHYAIGIGDGRLLVVQLNTSIGEPCRSGTKPGSQGTYLEPMNSQCDAFNWLRNVLADHRTKFGEDAPVILIQHYGYDSRGIGADDYAYRGYWWAPEYRRQLAETIAPYHVIAFIHGHTHSPQFTTPGTKYDDPSFGSDLSSAALTAGDAAGRA